MNKKELAIGVYRHPLIQEVLKKEIVDPSVINRLIVEEVLSEDEELEKYKQRIMTAVRETPAVGWREVGLPIKAEVGDAKWSEIFTFLHTAFQEAKSQLTKKGKEAEQGALTPEKTEPEVDQQTDQEQEGAPEPTEGFYAKLAELETSKALFAGATEAFKKLDSAILKGILQEFTNDSVYTKLSSALPDNLKDKLEGALNSLNEKEQQKVLYVLGEEGMMGAYVNHLKSKLSSSTEEPVTNTDADTDPDGVEQDEQEKEKVKEATKVATDPKNVSGDFDQSETEIPNLRYDEYINSLDHFFGMREDKATSFMRSYFLEGQVRLLHNNLLASLNNIKNPPSFEGGGGQRAFSRAADDLEENVDDKQAELIKKSEDYMQKIKAEQNAVEISKKNKITLKRELADQADILLDAKRIAKAYRQHGTSKSLDAEFDGSTLEKQLNIILAAVQMHNARLINIISDISNEVAKEKETLQEAPEMTRDQKIDEIEQVYKEMGNFYKNNLRISLENKEFKKATQGADKMLEIVKPIIRFFPKTIVHTQSGRIISISDAIISLESKIKSYKKVLRDIYMTVKDEEVTPIQLSRILVQIDSICKSIDDNFDVPCQINETELKKTQDNLPPQEGALTDEPVEPEDEKIGGINLPEPSGDLEGEEGDPEAFPVLGGGTEEPEAEDTPVEPEGETKETFKIHETEPWKDLNEKERSAVLSFIKNYNFFISNLEEILSPKDPKSAFQRRRKKNKEKLSKNLKKFMNDVNLYGAGGKERIEKILKAMKPKDRNSFLQMIVKENDIIKELVRILGQNLEEPKEKSTRRLRNRYGYSQSKRGRFEEQLSSKLEPIIEQVLRGNNG